MESSMQLQSLPIEKLRPKAVSYRDVDIDSQRFRELYESIKLLGVLTPLVVRPFGDDYEILSGQHRFVAAQMLKHITLPCHILQVKDESVANAIEIVTNAVHKRPNAIDYARGFSQLLHSLGGPSHIRALSKMVSKSTKWVMDQLSLLSLHDDIQKMLIANEFSVSSGIALAKLPHKKQLEFVHHAKKMPCAQFVSLVRNYLLTKKPARNNGRVTANKWDIRVRKQRELRRALDDPTFIEYALTRPITEETVGVVKDVLLWVTSQDHESLERQSRLVKSFSSGDASS
jgi:ParB family chromosome partitioning protein